MDTGDFSLEESNEKEADSGVRCALDITVRMFY
jgi:hypothetical protein